MPKSRNKKNHKKRSANYTNQVKAARKSAQRQLMAEFQKKQLEKLENAEEHVTGEVVENTDINVDVNVDDIDVSMDDLEDIEDITEVEEESEEK